MEISYMIRRRRQALAAVATARISPWSLAPNQRTAEISTAALVTIGAVAVFLAFLAIDLGKPLSWGALPLAVFCASSTSILQTKGAAALRASGMWYFVAWTMAFSIGYTVKVLPLLLSAL